MPEPQWTFFVGASADGKFFAVREKEPLFCFERTSEADAVAAAEEALADYARRFLADQGAPRFRARALDALPVHTLSSRKSYVAEVA